MRGIAFTSELMPKVLDGTKTQTRRLSAYWDKLRNGDRLWLKTSRFMKKVDSPGMIELTEDVREEALQDISEEDAVAEGCLYPRDYSSPRGWFKRIWDSIHTKPGERWDDNPTVRVITFRKVVE